MAEKPLTGKQERFIEEYLIDLNGSAAYLRAGYKCKNSDVAATQACTLLKNPKVAHAIKEANDNRSAKTKLTQEWVIEKLNLCVAKSLEEEEVQKWDYEHKKLAGTGRYIYDSKGATKALELLGKHLGMYRTDVNLSGLVGVKIIDDIDSADSAEDTAGEDKAGEKAD